MTEQQQADFERYMHIVPKQIAKHAPKFVGDKDFEQDCYLEMIEYMLKSQAFGRLELHREKSIRLNVHMKWFVETHSKKYNNEPLLALYQEEPEPFENARRNEIFENVHLAINALPTEQLRTIIRMRFGFVTGDTMTLNEVGIHIGKDKERVRQLQNEAIRRLRKSQTKSGKYLLSQTFPSETIMVHKKTVRGDEWIPHQFRVFDY